MIKKLACPAQECTVIFQTFGIYMYIKPPGMLVCFLATGLSLTRTACFSYPIRRHVVMQQHQSIGGKNKNGYNVTIQMDRGQNEILLIFKCIIMIVNQSHSHIHHIG